MIHIKNFKLSHTDSWENGPRLHHKEINNEQPEKEEEEEDDDINYISFPVERDKCRCYQIILGDDYEEEIFLGVFDNLHEADSFAKIQYTLYTNNFPFINDIIGRAKIDLSEFSQSLIKEEDQNKGEKSYLIIISDDHFKTHSLNSLAKYLNTYHCKTVICI